MASITVSQIAKIVIHNLLDEDICANSSSNVFIYFKILDFIELLSQNYILFDCLVHCLYDIIGLAFAF